MKEKPFFSIVTISFNQGRFLESCIKSVLSQKHISFEYIIIDANSKDNSHDIIHKHKKSIDHIIIEKDLGPADGLNKGFNLARGQFLYYLNADDELYEDALMKVYKDIQAYKNKDIFIYDGSLIDIKGNFIRYMCSTRINKYLFAANVTRILQPGTFFRNNAFRETIGFNIQNYINWDTELICDFIIKGFKFRSARILVGKYRYYEGTITHTKKFDKIRKKNREQMVKKLNVNNPLIVKLLSIFLKPYKHLLCFYWYVNKND